MLFPTPERDPELYPYRAALQFAFYNALNWQVAIGIPTVLFMQQIGADSFQTGLVFAWTFLLTPAQVLATSLLPRLGFKRLALTGWSIRGWCLLVPVAIVVLAPVKPVQPVIYAMILAMFLYSLNRAIGAAALTTWFYQLIPAGIRGRYWATDQILAALAGLGILGISATLFAVLPPAWAFSVQYLIAVFGAWKAHRLLNQLPDVPRPAIISLGRVLRETPRLVFGPGAFRTYLWMSVGIFVSITPIAPFTAFYLKSAVRLPAAHIMVFAMLTYLGVIGANWLMRRKMDRVGVKPFFRLCYLLYALVAAGWLFFLMTDGRWTPLLPIFFVVQGVAAGCWTSTNLSYLAKLLPEQDRALPVSVHAALVTFLGGCTPVIWGLLLKNPTGIDAGWFGFYFATLLVGALGMLGLLAKLHEEPGPAEPLLQGAWLLRPFRAMASLINLVEQPRDKVRRD
jgi:MFS family permease